MIKIYYSDSNALTVNVDKTKIMVFKKGGHNCQNSQLFYQNLQLKTVNLLII